MPDVETAPSRADGAAASFLNPIDWADHFARSEGRRYWPCEALVRALAGRHFRTLLEVGCGDGANLALLAVHAAQVVGMDWCGSALEMARSRDYQSRESVTLLHGDIHMLNPLLRVDGVVDVMSSQHVAWGDHPGLYAGYRAVLDVGGWFFLYHLGHGTSTRPGQTDRVLTVDRATAVFPEAGLICLPTGRQLQDAVSHAGFVVQRYERLTREYADGRRQAVYYALEAEAR